MRLDLSRRTDGELLREFSALVEKDRRSTSEMLVYIGEIQARRLFAPAGYSSMYKYCVHQLHWSEEMAWKRTQVARLARRFPVILEMIGDGRLHLTAVVKLLPYRMARDFPELLKAAVHKTKSEIELLLAERFPRPDAPTEVRPLVTSAHCQKLFPETVVTTHVSLGAAASGCLGGFIGSPAPACLGSSADSAPTEPESADSMDEDVSESQGDQPDPQLLGGFDQELARIQALAPQRYLIQVTVGQATHDKLRRVQELLGHQVPPRDLEQLLDRSFDLTIRQLEHAKFAATDKPRQAQQRSTVGKRHVPAAVKRAVHERDGGTCTFVSESGHRCDERRDLQYDHIEPFARGGEATLNGIRLLCPTHNQYEAERVFGAGFMEQRRKASR